MEMLDWIIVGMSMLIAIGIGFYFTKKATASKDDYLLAGRNLGWFVAGPGWNRVAKLSDIRPLRGEIGRDFLAWGVSIVWLYSLLLSIGYLLFLEWTKGFSLLAISVVSGYVLYNLMVNGKILVDRHHHE
jgi:Na+/proline symporter